MGQVASYVQNRRVRNRNRNRRDVAAQADPEQQLTYSNSNGPYFGTHFLMCGCKFELAKPESYLFGDNSDLDQLGTRAIQFPHPIGPPGSDEIRPLNLKVNCRKETVRFSRPKNFKGGFEEDVYVLCFTFDCDVDCIITVHMFAKEAYVNGQPTIVHRNNRQYTSEDYDFSPGANQIFCHHIVDATPFDLSQLQYTSGFYFPLVIAMRTLGTENVQMQTTLCTLDPTNDPNTVLAVKPLRQKVSVDGVVFLLQEIFGIENKEHDGDDSGLECIICMSEVRDTVILPCRHLCLCSNCADTLRYKLNNCPICRAPFRALIRLRAARQTRHQVYETISLVEGLNGSNGGASRSSDGEETRPNVEAPRSKPARKEPLSRFEPGEYEGLTPLQVLQMDELEDDKILAAECIEMAYLKNEEFIRKEQEAQNAKANEGFSNDSSSSEETQTEAETETEAEAAAETKIDAPENVQTTENEEDDENEEEEKEKEALQERRKSLQPGSQNSSSQLLEHSK
ncbi:unnamed protein product [Caenorhabditis angaria]|uniref:RING-type E3 ubiquitin transferase n=1 Tax=Caenorhabditis angaria TaxID=860376 RepID=A0A9P1N9K8_9PELO|nr:unnamed protein product [Caenorhabditis angaria]